VRRPERGTSPAAGDLRLEFAYDYLGRRIEKKVYTYDEDWVLTEHRRFVWGGAGTGGWLLSVVSDTRLVSTARSSASAASTAERCGRRRRRSRYESWNRNEYGVPGFPDFVCEKCCWGAILELTQPRFVRCCMLAD
jgi:hypothetical protein